MKSPGATVSLASPDTHLSCKMQWQVNIKGSWAAYDEIIWKLYNEHFQASN